QVQGAAADVHPIAYYAGLNLWMQLVGQSPFAARLLSVFIGTITVAALFTLARTLFSKRTALVAMLLAALSPFHVYYSQEARMYAPLALGCVLVVLFFVKVNRDWRLEFGDFTHHVSRNTHHASRDTQYATRITHHAMRDTQYASRISHHAIRNTLYAIRYWILLSISAAFSMYMQNLAAFFLLAFGLSTLPRPKTFFKVALAGAGAFVFWLPWFVNVTSQFAKLQQAYWVTRPNFTTLLQTLLIYHAGEEFVATAKAGVVLPLFTGIILLVMLVFRLVVESRPPHLTGLAEFNALRNITRPVRCIWLASLAFGTPLLLFLASLYQPVYIQRALLPASLMYLIAISWLLAESQMPNVIRFALGGIVGVTFVAGLWAHYTFASFPRPSFQSAVSYLKQNLAQGDVIVHSNKLTYLPMYYYNRILPQKFIADPSGSGSDTLALPTQQVLGLYAVTDLHIAISGAKRIWLARWRETNRTRTRIWNGCKQIMVRGR
ncbi:MAG: glycosyltransferase family 39 protein, partial [Chloroflexi bacterium]|nr:glycosyltransferase family 39 protein [Chloroflexota bacterium]